MAWGRLDDRANGNAKLLALSDGAWRMWGCALIYCQANLTDGFVPEHAIHTFGVRAEDKPGIADELCRALVPGKGPCWHRVEGGYRVHDYLDWNDTREDILREREKSNDRKRRWRDRHSHADGDADGTAPETRSEQTSTTTTTTTTTGTTTRPTTRREITASSAPPADAAPALLVFPTVGNGGTEWRLTEATVAEWKGLYPDLDVLGECRRALAWVKAKPQHRKTASGMPAFLVKWFNRSTNDGRRPGSGSSVQPQRGRIPGSTLTEASRDKYAGMTSAAVRAARGEEGSTDGR